jgi:two-component system chemotaxis response regulator CheB
VSVALAREPVNRIRVMIVDDSAVVRGLTRRWLEAEPRIELLRPCTDGAQAITEAGVVQPDVILLDVEMPTMDGLEALPGIRRAAPRAKIIMASTLTRKGAATTIKALSLGAADYIAKPEATALGGADAYRQELIGKIVALGAARPLSAIAASPQSVTLRAAPARNPGKPLAMVVAASTGGPSALQSFLAPIASRINMPILIVQHMPPIFTATLAEHLGRFAGKPAREAINGEPLKAGLIYVAPGGKHLALIKRDHGAEVVIDDSAPIHFCKPAVDALFLSASYALDGRVLGVVLTGMGSDGKKGALAIADNGGNVIAQDEATSVIWGMPGSAANAGACAAVLPINEIGPKAVRILSGDFS